MAMNSARWEATQEKSSLKAVSFSPLSCRPPEKSGKTLAPVYGDDVDPVDLPDLPGQLEQFQGILEGEGLDQLAFPEIRELAVFALALLHVGPVLAELGGDGLSGNRIRPDLPADVAVLAVGEDGVDLFMERGIERGNN